MAGNVNGPKSFARRVRDAAARMPEFSAGEISVALNIQSRADMARLRVCIRDLRRDGSLEIVSRGRYRITDKSMHETPVRRKILRAMSIIGTFTPRQVIRAAGCDKSYAHAMIRTLVADGDVEHVGRVRVEGPFKVMENSYRVRHGAEFYVKHVIEKGGES